MGNICSRSKNEPEAFSSPGRVLGSANPPPGEAGKSSSGPRAPLPAKASTGRTLGNVGASGAGADTADTADARTNAAIAAQKRAESASAGNKGKLGSKLAAQKAQTQTQTLNEASQDERAARDADNAASARRWE
ncbi:hypothetical protein BDV28DRAFT_110997 [Aspergillus coremiiformis]|uniref:Uncharacterized protein n=1 Tax=Aspergillus coremiiformis TaxID=138285 RepID=A0A5N6Z6H2_9EURO|nr:hypothetical protein BDV28DRAFT_110997 [Aspergillus coremiiformis]